MEGINVHRYGAHVFHTNNEDVWNYVNRFATFNNYINQPIAVYKNEVYNLPFNMNTFNRLWGVKSPDDAIMKIKEQCEQYENPKNLEEQALCLVGKEIYEKLIKGYTEKQWGRSCSQLEPDIIKRLPLRFTYDNNYFNDRYQGIPVGGYTPMIEKMLNRCDVLLNVDYSDFIKDNQGIVQNIVYSGAIDEFFDYCMGELEYRSLRFETKTYPKDNMQGNAVVNYTEKEIPYTRIIEHKHFEKIKTNNTVISYEYPVKWVRGTEPYYPIANVRNADLYAKYVELSKKHTNIIFGGRLGEYKYYDMGKVIERALEISQQSLNRKI